MRCTVTLPLLASCLYMMAVTQVLAECRRDVHREEIGHPQDPKCLKRRVRTFSCLGTCASAAIPVTDQKVRRGYSKFVLTCTCCKPKIVKTKYIRFKGCNSKLRRSVIQSCQCSSCTLRGNSWFLRHIWRVCLLKMLLAQGRWSECSPMSDQMNRGCATGFCLKKLS